MGKKEYCLTKNTTKVHPIITNEVRNSTLPDQDLIDASKDDSSSGPVEDGHAGYEGESESESKAFEDAPSWARLLYKEVRKQGSEFSLLKAQFTTFKAVVNQHLGEYEKSVEFMSEKFDEFELQLDDSKRDIHLLWGEKRGS